MNCHQILTGAVNAGDHCYSVGSVEGIPFSVYAAGCNIVILASDFQRVQIIPGVCHGNIQVSCLDCSTDLGKIASAYGKHICVFEPTPLLDQKSTHHLDYRWVQTATFETDCYVHVISLNLEGSRLLTGGECIQMWHLSALPEEHIIQEEINFQVNCDNQPIIPEDESKWDCIWKCKTAYPVSFLKFSPDGTLFASAGKADRLVKIWYGSGKVNYTSQLSRTSSILTDVNYTFIYLAHPRAITGLSWRKSSKYMPRDSVANMLITSCRDNICRVWVQTLLPEDGLVNLQQQADAQSSQISKQQSQRHKRRIMQQLKHMKSFSQYKRRQASQFTEDSHETIPTLPSTYSVHDFHSFGLQGSSVAPGVHFHLSASINAETDIPLVPTMIGRSNVAEPNFVIHWLNNKEMSYTQIAEQLLQEISQKLLQQEESQIESDHLESDDQDNFSGSMKQDSKSSKGKMKGFKSDVHESADDEFVSKQNDSIGSSSASLATDVSAGNIQVPSADVLDKKLDALLRDWHRNVDILFSIHPIDGSFLIWEVRYLDECIPGAFRQAQVNFTFRIVNAIPLGDSATMSQQVHLYLPYSELDLRPAVRVSVDVHKQPKRLSEQSSGAEVAIVTSDQSCLKEPNKKTSTISHQAPPTPIVCMITKHNNGSFNLWHLTFGENSQFTQVLTIGHSCRVCGHRFRVNDITCHPVLPLLLTTSHHNLPAQNSPLSSPQSHSFSGSCCLDSSLPSGFCSELILWKVDAVGPLSKSGGIAELARLNSPKISAFANVAWIPTLLPSTTLGGISNSPSACFVASDGCQLRVYQAVIDARTLLAEISSSARKKSEFDLSMSSSTSSGLGYRQSSLQETFRIVSLQSAARPGCIIELDAITDATHDWKNTQLLHIFQEQLITGYKTSVKTQTDKGIEGIGLLEPSMQAVVDLRHGTIFEEPFYLVVLEKDANGTSVLHMWRILVASQFGHEENQHFSYIPDSNLIQEGAQSTHSSRSNSPEPPAGDVHSSVPASPLQVTTTKVCEQILPLPSDVEVIHATPAAGHLSSSNIYPACFAPYLICTACSDGTVRFWRCETNIRERDVESNKNEEYTWVEWEMLLNRKSSAVHVSGQPLFVSSAYSGRLACAYKCGRSFMRPSSNNPDNRYVNLCISIFECESTGGSEWVQEDTIHLKNVILPQKELGTSWDIEELFDVSMRNRRTADTLKQRLPSNEDFESEPLQRMLAVPSYTTLHTLRHAISEQGNQCQLTQKSLVQLDWVSTEDGSHVLTVAVGSKILLFTPVSTDIAQANVQAMKASKSASRPLLKQASSMAAPLVHAEEIRWMRIRTTYLSTSDGLLPLPMQISWVRDGILVVGMDNEMHIYTQWRPTCSEGEEGKVEEKEGETGIDSRNLKEQELLTRAQETSQLRLPGTGTGTLSRSTSYNILNAGGETKKKKEAQPKSSSPRDSIVSLGPLPDFGMFEASRFACPVLPQYHPKQLMEMLGFGKIRRVKAILSHLVRCLGGTENVKKTFLQVPETVESRDSESDSGARSWSRSRALSIAATSSPNVHSPLDPQGSISVFPEEVQLDYVEIQSIPPLPLFTLLAADSETHGSTPTPRERDISSQDYSGLFDPIGSQAEESLDDILDERFQLTSKREFGQSAAEEKSMLTQFGMKQAHLLTRLLTHSHLPGLSSLDQMHLLALADTVSSFNTEFSDHFKTAKTASAKETVGQQEDKFKMSTDALDDCGLRFLLAMRHHIYLVRCLPLVQRTQLQYKGLGSHSMVWAFHSETQEELLQLIPTVQRGNPRWNELREVGIGWWVRSNTVLRRIMEKVAKAAFQVKSDPLDAALFYLAMKKKNVVWGLFRSVHDNKMTTFFQHNFTEDKWRKSALKNAFALLGKQRFHHAAAFFLLAGAVKDAVDVCLTKLDDLQLAMVIIRLYEGELDMNTPGLRRLLFEEILGCDADGSNYQSSSAHPDPFLRSMAHWMLQDYSGALKTLIQTDVGHSHPKAVDDANKSTNDDTTANPSVFNFYLFLRTHPLVVRGQIAQNAEEKRKSLKNSIAKANGPSRKIAVQGLFEDAITPLERRLFFTTAHAHFRAGCPALALEVLSRLPNHILPDSDTSNGDLYSPTSSFAINVTNVDSTIQSGALPNGDISSNVEYFDWSQPISTTLKTESSALDFGWSTPVSLGSVQNVTLHSKSEDGSDEEMGLEMKAGNGLLDESVIKNKEAKLDIMAQQLKFIACLKIMMEELSTLATGFEVDGGQLRYQLYIWLERSVTALRDLCNYGHAYSLASDSEAAIGASSDNCDINRDRLGSSGFRVDSISDAQKEKLPTLHEILLSDKLEFEAKLHRATRRKQWLKANESLLRTLLGYCSLHGAHGGGLAAVRMELILLLQELQQERSQQQLLSPLPFPTTLPLVAASVACQKTVIADPIRHLQAMTHDILLSIMEIGMPPFMTSTSYSRVLVLRDLGTSLSACIYQSLCDSDNFIVKQTSGKGLNMETFISSSVVYQNSHLLAGHIRSPRFSSGEESLTPSTQPSKWPGVQSLRALMARDKDEDSPKLHTLLCEAFVATYLSQLCHALATCDCHVLYRLVSQKFNENLWGMLFGGGAKRLLHVATAAPAQIIPISTEKESPSGESGLLNSLSKQRVKLRMKLLGQLSLATTRSSIKEDRPTYREQFISPEMSMMSCFMSKPQLPAEWCILDYDSSNSIPSDDEDLKCEGADDDVFGEALGQLHTDVNTVSTKKPKVSETMEQLDPSSYSWGILRYAIVKIAYCHLLKFLSISGIESPELPVTSQMIHATLKILERWLQFLKNNMNSFGRPPPNYIAGCYVENIQKGPAILKYKQLLEPLNTPFRSHSSALPVKRLWNYLVRQEEVQDIFIRYIFSRRLSHLQPLDDVIGEDIESVDGIVSDPIKIIHKDQDSVSSFCINNQNYGIIALATTKEIQELDISLLLEPLPWLEDEAEYDILNISKAPESLPPTDYLVVHHPADKLPSIHGQGGSVGGSSYSSPTGTAPAAFGAQTGRTTTVMKGLHFPGSSSPQFCQFVLERSRHMLKPLKKHKIDGVRRLCPHPEHDFYLSGSHDGSVHLWKWCHQQPFSSPRPSGTFAKVTKVMFNDQGNKFGVTDGDGNISLWQANMNCQPYFSTQCHSKQASDFVFVNSSSLIATAGHATENKNVCMWDTLLPQRNSLVVSFNCHENGSSAILYAKQNQLLITAGKKGFVCLFDIRQRQLIQSFQAHESSIKCLALEPSEEFFVTGASDGDIKVWSLPVCVMFYSFTGEHIRSTLFRNLSVGVSQVCVDSSGRLFSCGADGSMKLRTLPDRDQIVNTIY